jgi:pyruvate kinase
VQTLDAVIRDAESGTVVRRVHNSHGTDDHDHAQAICEAAVTLAEGSDAQAIVAVTRGGGTARRLSALRPRVPILATTDREDTARRLAIYWGVTPVCTDVVEAGDTAGAMIGRQLVARGLVAAGTPVVLVSINPDLTRLDANYLKIQRL